VAKTTTMPLANCYGGPLRWSSTVVCLNLVNYYDSWWLLNDGQNTALVVSLHGSTLNGSNNTLRYLVANLKIDLVVYKMVIILT